MRERELKLAQDTNHPVAELSLPMRERELKLLLGEQVNRTLWSLPMRERELKLCVDLDPQQSLSVAPHAGARIETSSDAVMGLS